MGDLAKLMARHGLHWTDDAGPRHGAHIKVFGCGSTYRHIDRMSFVETSDSKTAEQEEAVAKIRRGIEMAVKKTLFEIEVHGRKDTIHEIVEQVIREIKEGK